MSRDSKPRNARSNKSRFVAPPEWNHIHGNFVFFDENEKYETLLKLNLKGASVLTSAPADFTVKIDLTVDGEATIAHAANSAKAYFKVQVLNNAVRLYSINSPQGEVFNVKTGDEIFIDLKHKKPVTQTAQLNDKVDKLTDLISQLVASQLQNNQHSQQHQTSLAPTSLGKQGSLFASDSEDDEGEDDAKSVTVSSDITAATLGDLQSLAGKEQIIQNGKGLALTVSNLDNVCMVHDEDIIYGFSEIGKASEYVEYFNRQVVSTDASDKGSTIEVTDFVCLSMTDKDHKKAKYVCSLQGKKLVFYNYTGADTTSIRAAFSGTTSPVLFEKM